MKKYLCILICLAISLIMLSACAGPELSGGGSTTAPENTAGTTEPDPTEETTVPDATEAEVTEPEVTEPEVTEPEVTEPEVTEPEVTEPEVTEPEVTEPEVTEPEVTEPEVTEPKVTEPEVTEPEVTEPEVTEPEVTEPEVTEPEVTEPEVTEPEVIEPEVTEPEITEPEITEPEVTEPEYIVPEGAYVPRHDGVTLKIGIPNHPNVLDYYDNAFTKWLQEETGIQLEFVKYAYGSADYKKQLETEYLAGYINADVLVGFNLGTDLYNAYGEVGYLLNLSQYLQDVQRSNIFWSRLVSVAETDTCGQLLVEEAANSLFFQNGKGEIVAYGLPSIDYSVGKTVPFMPFINTKWLDALQLDMPTNLQELVEVLKAFRDQDPNGNGMQDEIPMLGCRSGITGGDTIAWLINFFLYCDSSSAFNIENGQLYIPQSTEEYREALKFINSLVEQNLLHVNTLNYNESSLKAILSNADVLGVVVGNPAAIFNSDNIVVQYEPLNLYGNTYYAVSGVKYDTFITAGCKDVSAAWDLLMLMYTQEAAARQCHGVLGEDWDYAEENTMTEFGIPATLKVYKDSNWTVTTDHWGIKCASFYTLDVTEAVLIPSGSKDQKIHSLLAAQYKNQKAAYENMLKASNASMICPELLFNEAEYEMLGGKNSAVKKVVQTWLTKFVNGVSDINDDITWNAYLAEMSQAGAQEYLAVAQKCYDRMYPNGH